jgi:pyruvate dehydrogenase E2 component (dihydrolipoamide acetyltransferase)
MPKLSDQMARRRHRPLAGLPGDRFERGDGLIEVETDKATVVYEAESDGTLDSILVPEGATARSGPDRDARERWVDPAARAVPSRLGRRIGRAASQRDAGGETHRRSSASRSTTSPAPARAAGSRARTSKGPRPSQGRNSSSLRPVERAIPGRSS